MGSPGNGSAPDRQIGALEAEMRHMRELLTVHKDRTAQEFRRIELRINAKSREIKDLERSVNRAVLYLAIAAAAVIFELVRKGNPF